MICQALSSSSALSVAHCTAVVRVRPCQAGVVPRAGWGGGHRSPGGCFSREQNLLQKQARKPLPFLPSAKESLSKPSPERVSCTSLCLAPYVSLTPALRPQGPLAALGTKPSCRPILSKLRHFTRRSGPGSPSGGNMESPQENSDDSLA